MIDQSLPIQWEDRSHFFGIAARLIRRILVDHARARDASKRDGGLAVTLEETVAFAPNRAPDILEVDDALNRLAEVDEQQAKVIELRYFAGMTRLKLGCDVICGRGIGGGLETGRWSRI